MHMHYIQMSLYKIDKGKFYKKQQLYYIELIIHKVIHVSSERLSPFS